MDTIAAMCTIEGLNVERDGICVTARRTNAEALGSKLGRFVALPEPTAYELALDVNNKESEKYHDYLDNARLSLDWASQRLDTRAAMQLL